MYDTNVNVNLMVTAVIQIKFGITKNVDATAKIETELMVGKVKFGIQLDMLILMINI